MGTFGAKPAEPPSPPAIPWHLYGTTPAALRGVATAASVNSLAAAVPRVGTAAAVDGDDAMGRERPIDAARPSAALSARWSRRVVEAIGTFCDLRSAAAFAATSSDTFAAVDAARGVPLPSATAIRRGLLAVGELPLHLNTGGDVLYVPGAQPPAGVRAPFAAELTARLRVFTDACNATWTPYGGGDWHLLLLPSALAAAFELAGRDVTPAHAASGFVALAHAPPAMAKLWKQLASQRDAATTFADTADMQWFWDGEVWHAPPTAWPAEAGAPLAGKAFDSLTAVTDVFAADGGVVWCAQHAEGKGDFDCEFLWRRSLPDAAFEWYIVSFGGCTD